MLIPTRSANRGLQESSHLRIASALFHSMMAMLGGGRTTAHFSCARH